MRKLALHWQIIIGLALGVIWALLSSWLGWSGVVVRRLNRENSDRIGLRY